MTALLTPEQIDGIKARDKALFLEGAEGVGFAGRDRRALLRDREAIAERLEYRLEELRSACRIFDGNPDWRPVVERTRDDIRALVTAIRGNQGDSK